MPRYNQFGGIIKNNRWRHKYEYKNILVMQLPDNIDLELIEELLGNIHFNEKGCWVRGDDSTTYTSIKHNGKIQHAHRVSFEIFNGQKVPEHLFGCHECDIKACINPEHIFIGNSQLNMQDARIKGRVKDIRIEKSKWAEFPKLRKLIKGY